MVDADFSVLDPFIVGTEPSQLVLMLHPDERAQSYFILDSTIAGTRRKMKVFQDVEEIVHTSLENEQLPVIELDELKKAVLASRKNRAPVALRIRHLVLRSNLPATWRIAIRQLFESNLLREFDKSTPIQRHLGTLRNAIRATMFERYLSRCIWLDAYSGVLGEVVATPASDPEMLRFTFSPFMGNDAQMFGFIESLDKDEHGNYVAMEDEAIIYPIPLLGKEWNSPTVHFNDSDFRERIKANEFYSLYRGMEKLRNFGAPVLVYEPEQIHTAIRLRILKPSGTGSDFMSLSVSSFASHNVVWDR